MLLAILISSLLLLFSLSLHYRQHFRLCSIYPNKKSLSPLPSTTDSDYASNPINNWCKCSVLAPIDDFDFFPSSFFYYIIFKLVLCMFIATILILTYYNTHNKLSTDILFEYSVDKHTLFVQQTIYYTSNTTAAYNISQFSDYILIISIMILSLWETLFSWYKYYSTLVVVLKCKIISTQTIIIKFTIIYAILFCAIFTLQFFYYCYLWPLILILYFTFNIFCICKFASILIGKYRLFIEQSDRFTDNVENNKVLSSVSHMRFISIICCVLQTIYLGLFIIFYTANTLYLLPILWSISAFIDTFNFARNRTFMRQKFSTFNQKCNPFCCCYFVTDSDTETQKEPTQTNNNTTTTTHSKPSPIEIIIESDEIKLDNVNRIGMNIMGISTSQSSFPDIPSPKSQTSCDTLSVPKMDKPFQIAPVFTNAHLPQSAPRFMHKVSLSDTSVTSPQTPQTPQTPIPLNAMVQSQSYNAHHTMTPTDSFEYDINDRSPKEAQMQLKHERNISEPVTVQQQQMVESLDIFAKYGFCSRRTLTAMFELDRCCNKINTMNVQITR